MDNDKINRIKSIVEGIIKQEDMFLVDVEIKHAETLEVWVLLDSEKGGVNVDVCSAISRELADILEEINLFSSAYRLNVSSPGLSRSLTDIRQYPKNRGRTVKVKYKTDEGYQKAEGILQDVTDDTLVLAMNEDHQKEISFNSVVEAKVIPKI